MFSNSMTDDMLLREAIQDCQEAGLVVTLVLSSDMRQVIILVKEENGFPLTSGTFDTLNALGAISFLMNTRNDYRSWK